MRPGDVAAAVELSRRQLEPCLSMDWNQRAGDLEWTCRQALDHIVDTLILYSASVA